MFKVSELKTDIYFVQTFMGGKAFLQSSVCFTSSRFVLTIKTRPWLSACRPLLLGKVGRCKKYIFGEVSDILIASIKTTKKVKMFSKGSQIKGKGIFVLF